MFHCIKMGILSIILRDRSKDLTCINHVCPGNLTCMILDVDRCVGYTFCSQPAIRACIEKILNFKLCFEHNNCESGIFLHLKRY